MPFDTQSTRPRIKLSVLDAPQKRLWAELGATPAQFTLYGGTAIALRLGHRQSIDFDFFSNTAFDPDRLLATVPYLAGADVRQKERGTLTALVDRGGSVKLSFVAPEKPMTMIGTPFEVKRPRLRLAPLIDLAAAKLAALPARSTAKDYLDVHALITKGKISLALLLAAMPTVFPTQRHNPHVILKSLCYFGDGDLPTLPIKVKRDLASAVAAVDLDQVDALIVQTAADPALWKRLP